MRGACPTFRGGSNEAVELLLNNGADIKQKAAPSADRSLFIVRTDEMSSCLSYMGNSKQEKRDQRSATPDATLAKTLAPEDIRVGDFVTMLHTQSRNCRLACGAQMRQRCHWLSRSASDSCLRLLAFR